jgi:glycosyltransferase involved in cell wall biosynthesis
VVWTDNAGYLDVLAEEGFQIPAVVCLRGNLWREAKTADAAYVERTKRGLQLAAIVTPVCGWLERELKEQLPGQRSRVIYQGMAVEEWHPVPPLNLQHPSIAIIQNHNILPKVKGLLHFRDVIAAMPDVHFYVSRGQYATYFPLVEARFQDLKNVEYVTANTAAQVRQLLSSVDAYVLASGLDCCPYTVLEAGLMGRPVIASDVGGVPEIIREGVTGFTVHNGNVDAWANRIREALASEWPQSREYVAENFGWQHIAPQVEEVIRGVKA